MVQVTHITACAVYTYCTTTKFQTTYHLVLPCSNYPCFSFTMTKQPFIYKYKYNNHNNVVSTYFCNSNIYNTK